jgi:hypothetical protein
MMMNVCPSVGKNFILYPPEGLINPNVFIYYDYTQATENSNFQYFFLFKNIRCRGFFFQAIQGLTMVPHVTHILIPIINHALCANVNPVVGYRNFSSPLQKDKFCWNNSFTFNGRPYAVSPDICNDTEECISQYRIHDGMQNCLNIQDEEMSVEKNYCIGNVGRHRFQCFNDQHKYLPLDQLNSMISECSNSYDESWYGTGASLDFVAPCFKGQTTGCHRLKAYIQQSSPRNSNTYTSLISSEKQQSMNRLPFLSYCNTFWDLPDHVDEIPSSCQHWVCKKDQYQCRTGQCIEIELVCDGEWDCSDASDEESIMLIEKWSIHNSRLSNLASQLEKCRERYPKSPFSKICNTSFEFGCYRSQVSNPLDIQLNRPCINLTQIGDGVEDCYNAYDEKNTFVTNRWFQKAMWGFDFRCENDHRSHFEACSFKNNCTEILCSYYRNRSCFDTQDLICLEDDICQKNARCNGIIDCFHGEDEYWCPSGSVFNQYEYRIDKKLGISDQLSENFFLILYPFEDIVESNQQQLSKSIINLRNDQSFKRHSYQCNRGVAVLQMNETQCLCPPAYYGRWCEFFSDRISIIVHVNRTIELNITSNVTLKIKTNFLFNNRIIDHHEFDIIPTIERDKIIKHQFYLHYSRSLQMLEHKRWRYFNRTDIINNHPYSVHFDVFSTENNSNVKELGSWQYPIYFDYLPAFRLAIILRFPSWFGNTTLDPCWQNNCNENSSCMPIFNQNNSYYCSCKSGYYGRNCSMYESRCKTYCSANAFCQIDHDDLYNKENKLCCICSLGYFGPRCHLKYDNCKSNSCLNNGTCLSNYDRSGEQPYMCHCSERFYGSQCQNDKAYVLVTLNMRRAFSARATVVQLYRLYTKSHLVIQYQQAFHGVPSMITYYDPSTATPPFGVLKIYEDLSNPQYFIIYVLSPQPLINITSSPKHCPHASSLLSEGEFLDK